MADRNHGVITPSFNVYQRWGVEISKSGYTAVPNQLVYANLYLADDLKLSPSEYWIITIIISCWREYGRPQASKKFISDRMGVSERQVQRLLRSLERKGLAIANSYHDRPYKSNEFDLRGLIIFIKYISRITSDNRIHGRRSVRKISRADILTTYDFDHDGSEGASESEDDEPPF